MMDLIPVSERGQFPELCVDEGHVSASKYIDENKSCTVRIT